MTKNKKLLICIAIFAFCLGCIAFAIGNSSKKSIVASADTILQPATLSASAAEAQSISLVSEKLEENLPVLEGSEELQEIFDEDDSEIAEYGFVKPNIPLPPSLRRTITFRGYVYWKDDDGNTHPLRQVKIQITDNDVSDYTTYTDDYGYFYLTNSFIYFNPVEIIAHAVDNNENIKVTNKDGELYSYVLESGITMSQSTNVVTLDDLIIEMRTEAGQAFQISQAVITARDFAYTMMKSLPSPVSVQYPIGETCAYYKDSKLIKITNKPRESIRYPHPYASWDVIMHEYGHHIHMELNTYEMPKGEHDSSKNDAVIYGKAIGVKLAWTESWPTVFGMIAQQYYVEQGILSDIKTVGDTYYTAYDGIDYDLNTTGIRYGEACERSIMAVLWDLYDDDIEENDTIALGYYGFWNVTTKNEVKTFSEFIQVFYNTYPHLIDKIGANLAYYDIASNNFKVSNVSLNAPPEFSWWHGSTLTGYDNNRFSLKFYDANDKFLFTISLSHDRLTLLKYTLDMNQWEQILSADGNYFYWVVEAVNDHEGVVTGPYIGPKQRVEKPYNTSQLNNQLQITGDLVDYGFKMVFPTIGPACEEKIKLKQVL